MFYEALWPLEKQLRRGFQAEDADADPLRRWFSEHTDVRSEPAILREIGEFIETHAVKSVVPVDCIIGCPHEEPEGVACPLCPFWANRDRSPAAQPVRSAPWTDA